MSLTPGATHGPFVVGAPVGRGGLGELFAARDTAADRDVTVEVVPADLAADPVRFAELQRTVSTLTAIDHPNVARYYGLESDLDPPVVVSEAAGGVTVAAVVRAHAIPGTRDIGDDDGMPRIGLELTEALFVAHQVACGLEALHAQGVVHGRLHPSTIRMGADGIVRIGGFGFGSPHASDADTVAHVSPEQVQGQIGDRRSDAWAFGVLLYEMLAGVGPFLADQVSGTEAAVLRGDPEWSALPLDTPLAVRRLLRACMAKKPAARPADLASARRELQTYLSKREELDTRRRPVGAIASPPEPAPTAEPSPDPPTRIEIPEPEVAEPNAVTEADPVPVAAVGATLFAGVGDDSGVEPGPSLGPEREPDAPSEVAAEVGRGSRRRWSLVAALVIGAATGAASLWWLRPNLPEQPSRFIVSAPPSAPLAVDVDANGQLAISADGRLVAYAAEIDGRRRVYLRRVDDLYGAVVPDVEDAEALFFSPDARWLGVAMPGGAWARTPVGGGVVERLATRQGEPRGAAWGADGSIILAERRSGLFRVSETGGIRQALTTLDDRRGETGHYWPSLLPGGQAVLFSIVSGPSESQAVIAVLDLATKTIRRLVPGGRHAQYAPSGHLVYGTGSSLYAIPFDIERLEVRGHPVPVVHGVLANSSGSPEFRLSADGTLVYVAGDSRRVDPRVLTWVDAAGVEEVLPAQPRGYRAVRISPDGTRLAIELREPDSEIVIWDLARETVSPLLSMPVSESSPTWTPDGARVAFRSEREPQGIFWALADGTGAAERLQAGVGAWPFSWSRDGERLVVGTGGTLSARDTALDVGVTGTGGDATVAPLVATVSDERNAEISPDGRWLAHESAASGRPEVYLRPFPDVDAGRWAVSREGGRQPVWSPDGTQLYYAAGDGAIMQVTVDASDEVRIGEPVRLFAGPYAIGWAGRSFDIAPDGERFLMIRHDAAAREPARVVIVQAWSRELAP